MHEETTLRLPKIGCQSCMKKVTNALEPLQSVTVTATDIANKTVTINYDAAQISLRQIGQVLRTVGHTTITAESDEGSLATL
jgi:Copper chaperone